MQGRSEVPSVKESLALQPRLEQAGQPDPAAGSQISGAGSPLEPWLSAGSI